MQDLITRREAHAKGLKTFFTGIPCRNGHVTYRYVTNGACIGCLSSYKQVNVNPFTRQLVIYQAEKFYVPALSATEVMDLNDYILACVIDWMEGHGKMNAEIRNAYREAQRLREMKRKQHDAVQAARASPSPIPGSVG